MAGTELPLLGAAIKYYGYYGQATPQISFRNVGGGGTPAGYSNPPTVEQRYGWFGQPFRSRTQSRGFCPMIPRPAQQSIV
jgi:hypothetical protein